MTMMLDQEMVANVLAPSMLLAEEPHDNLGWTPLLACQAEPSDPCGPCSPKACQVVAFVMHLVCTGLTRVHTHQEASPKDDRGAGVLGGPRDLVVHMTNICPTQSGILHA